MSGSTKQGRTKREIFDIERHAFFITFSCYHRLPLLGQNRCKQIVLGQMDVLSRRHGVGVVGYVLMLDHLHALLRPVRSGLLSLFIQQWKRLTSDSIQGVLGLGTGQDSTLFGARTRDGNGKVHVWQKRYYPFNVYTPEKAVEKLEYMHNNPVRAGLVQDPCEWPWSTASHFLLGQPCPVTLCPMDGPIVFVTPMEQSSHKERLNVAAQPR